MIIKHSVKNHSAHKDEILERIERFKSYYNTKMPSDYVRQTGERIHLDNVHSDLHVHDILKPHLDYVFTEVLHEPMDQIGQHLKLGKFNDFDWSVHNAWFQQFLPVSKDTPDAGGHTWHLQPGCQFTSVYFVDLPDSKYSIEVLGLNEKLITIDAKDGDIITFPSWLQRRSVPNRGTKNNTIININSSFSLTDANNNK